MTSKANIEALRQALEAYERDKNLGLFWRLVDAAEAQGYEPGTSGVQSWSTRFLAEHKESGGMNSLEVVCQALCQSRKFECGEGTCSFMCMDQLGDPRKRGCSHAVRVHETLAAKIIEALNHDVD